MLVLPCPGDWAIAFPTPVLPPAINTPSSCCPKLGKAQTNPSPPTFFLCELPQPLSGFPISRSRRGTGQPRAEPGCVEAEPGRVLILGATHGTRDWRWWIATSAWRWPPKTLGVARVKSQPVAGGFAVSPVVPGHFSLCPRAGLPARATVFWRWCPDRLASYPVSSPWMWQTEGSAQPRSGV